MRVILAELGNEAFGGIALTIMFGRPILFHHRFGHQRNHGAHVRMNQRRAQHVVRIGGRTIAVNLVQTRRTVNRRRGQIPRAVEGQSVVAIQQYHLFKRLATLEVPQDALERRPE